MAVELIPDKETCLALLEKYQTPHHIVLHSLRVWEVARLLAEGLIERNYPVDRELLRASSLLHDIGKYPCIVEGRGYHDIRGAEILEGEGMPSVARLVVQHVILRGAQDGSIREEHVLLYADKRVVHDNIVSLEDRFVYLKETYGKSPEARRMLLAMKDEAIRLERSIFDLLDFEPEDVMTLLG